MKYYIGDKLVRTSNRIYTHAILRDAKVIACSGSYELAVKELKRLRNRDLDELKFIKDCIEALNVGQYKVQYVERIGRRTFRGWYIIREQREYYENTLKELMSKIDSYRIKTLQTYK